MVVYYRFPSVHASATWWIMEEFEAARKVLLGAVDTVLSIASTKERTGTASNPQQSGRLEFHGDSRGVGSSGGSGSGSRVVSSIPSRGESSSSLNSIARGGSRRKSLAPIEEHRRLFGYCPSKGKGPARKPQRKRKGTQWKKDCICLRDTKQALKPTPEEKIELAKMGLGLKAIEFGSDGDAEHIHKVILESFPVLDSCGGYTLLRLAENSHSMVEIDGPDCGMTVPYLRDILNQAKLYIRPLQKDITEEDVQLYSIPKVWYC